MSCSLWPFICHVCMLASSSLSNADPPVEFSIVVNECAVPTLVVAWCCAFMDCGQSLYSNHLSIARITLFDPSLASGGLVGACRQHMAQSMGVACLTDWFLVLQHQICEITFRELLRLLQPIECVDVAILFLS